MASKALVFVAMMSFLIGLHVKLSPKFSHNVVIATMFMIATVCGVFMLELFVGDLLKGAEAASA